MELDWEQALDSELILRGHLCLNFIDSDFLYILIENIKKQYPRHIATHLFYIAGSCIATQEINDIDIFPGTQKFNFLEIKKSLKSLNLQFYETANTLTINGAAKIPIQLCNYQSKNGEGLYNILLDFDYTHLQAGVGLYWESWDNEQFSLFSEFSDDFVSSKLTEFTQYDGSPYPLSSLFRFGKYAERGLFRNKATERLTQLTILCDIVERGFKSYEDFKDQLNSIDIAVAPDSQLCYRLFKCLKKCSEEWIEVINED